MFEAANKHQWEWRRPNNRIRLMCTHCDAVLTDLIQTAMAGGFASSESTAFDTLLRRGLLVEREMAEPRRRMAQKIEAAIGERWIPLASFSPPRKKRSCRRGGKPKPFFSQFGPSPD